MNPKELASIVANLPDSVTVTDMEGRITFVNKSFLKTYGYEEGEVLGRRIDCLFAPSDSTGIEKIAREARECGWAREIMSVRKDGTEFPSFMSSFPVQDERGDTVGIAVIGRDITDQREALRSLRERAERYHTIVEEQMELICCFLPDGRLTFVNEAYCRYFGMTCEELVGTAFTPHILDEDRERVEKLIASLGPESPVGMVEHCVVMPAGEIRCQEWTNRAIFDAEGRLAEYHAVGRDITDRLASNRRIAQLSRAVEGLAEMVVITDLNHKIIYVNAAIENVLGYKPEEVIGHEAREFFEGIPGNPPNMAQKVAREAVDGVWQGELLNRKKDGSFINVHVTVNWLRDERDDFIGTVGITLDITERKKAEERIKELYAIKSDFTSMVSHELRTPLTAIKEGINIILDGAAGEINEEQGEFLELAKRNVDRLTRLINDVLDFSKLEAGKLVMKMEENDINEVVNEVVEIHRLVARDQRLSLEPAIDSTLPGAVFDRDRITQVLTNLVNNAIKFTLEGSITISTARRGASLIVCVEDTGPGIREEDIDKLFHKFEQLQSKGRRRAGGTGLGLAISMQIVEQHKGEIWVESELGVGSRFYFTIPLSLGEAQSAESQ